MRISSSETWNWASACPNSVKNKGLACGHPGAPGNGCGLHVPVLLLLLLSLLQLLILPPPLPVQFDVSEWRR